MCLWLHFFPTRLRHLFGFFGLLEAADIADLPASVSAGSWAGRNGRGESNRTLSWKWGGKEVETQVKTLALGQGFTCSGTWGGLCCASSHHSCASPGGSDSHIPHPWGSCILRALTSRGCPAPFQEPPVSPVSPPGGQVFAKIRLFFRSTLRTISRADDFDSCLVHPPNTVPPSLPSMPPLLRAPLLPAFVPASLEGRDSWWPSQQSSPFYSRKWLFRHSTKSSYSIFPSNSQFFKR